MLHVEETWDRAAIEDHQTRCLRRLSDRLHQTDHPLYGGRLPALSDVDAIQDWPLTTKDQLRDLTPTELLAPDAGPIARTHASSGTTGQPTLIAYSANDLDRFADLVARSLHTAGARRGEVLHNAYGYGLFTGGLGLHDGGARLGLHVVPVSGGMTDRQIDLIHRLQPDVLSCTPSYALALADAWFRTHQTAPAIRTAVLGAEPWTEAMRTEFEDRFGLTATNIYGLSEVLGPGVAQEDASERGSGSYVWEDHFLPEIIDPETGEVLEDGSEGELVLTTLQKDALPLIRYRTGDLTSIHRDPHGARQHRKIAPIRGRVDDMLIVRGVNLHPGAIRRVLDDHPALGAYVQLVVSRRDRLDRLTIRFEHPRPKDDETTGFARLVSDQLRATIGLTVDVRPAAVGTLPRSSGGKTSWILDERPT